MEAKHTDIDWEKLVLVIDGENYEHELLDPQPPLEEAICETCDTQDPETPKRAMKSDEWAVWYDRSRKLFVEKHRDQGTRFYGSGGVMLCSMCLLDMVCNVDTGEMPGTTYYWKGNQ